MILIILKLITLKRHQTNDSSLFGLGGNAVGIERQGRVFGGCFGGDTLALSGGIGAGV